MDQVTSAERPLWRRILDFPLVAMLIGMAVIMLGTAIAVDVSLFVLPPVPGLHRETTPGPPIGVHYSLFFPPPVPGLTRETTLDLLAAAILIILYKLLIRRLGEHPRDDLRFTGSLRPLLGGLAGGFVIFALVVAIAAAVG